MSALPDVLPQIRKRCRKMADDAVVDFVTGVMAVALLPIGLALEVLDVLQHRNEVRT